MRLAQQNPKRSTKAEMDALRDRMVRLSETNHPLSVRNLFYQLTAEDGTGATIEKLESAYDKVCRLKTQLCRNRAIPWGYFTDSSRIAYDNHGFQGMEDPEFTRRCMNLYRRNVWNTTGIYPQLWVESRSLYPSLAGTAQEWGVSLYPSGGMASDSFVYQAAVEAVHMKCDEMVIVYVGDFDPSGLQIAETLETKLGEHLDYAAEDYNLAAPDLTFWRVAITAQQIIDYALPTKPVKSTQSRKRYDIADTVEAEAMKPDTLRGIVADAFESMLDKDVLRKLRTVEASERHSLGQRMLAMGQAQA